MEVRWLRVFLSVADSASFSRAAATLGVSVSTLSRQVRELEDEVGVSLLERQPTGVRLTLAGRRFREDLCGLLSQLDASLTRIKSAGTASTGRLRIGIVASISNGFARELLTAWHAEHPQVETELCQAAPSLQMSALLEHRLDVLLISGAPATIDLDEEQLWTEPVMAALPMSNPLARRAALTVSEIAGETFIITRQPPGPEVRDWLVRHLSDLRSSPTILPHDVERETLLSMVGLGFGITLVSGAETGVRYPDVAYVRLEDESLPFSAVWSPRNDNPVLRRFLSLSRTMARKRAQHDEPPRIPDPSP